MSSTTVKAPTAPASAHKGGRKSASLPPETVEYLKSWMMSPEHVAHPYPTEQEKAQIMAETGIELKQLTNWFVNNRKRFWKPRVEAKLQKHSSPSGAPTYATLPAGGGGLSISIHHVNPKSLQGGPMSLPFMPNSNNNGHNNGASSRPAPPAPPLYPGASGQAASPHHQQPNFGPAAPAVAPANDAPRREDEPHAISEGSGSSACNSDDDSIAAGASAAFGATLSKYLDSRLSTVGATGLTGADGGGYRRHEEVDVHVLRPDSSIDGDVEALPNLRDLTIKSSVPKERILATFKCPISYTIPYDIEHDRRKVQSRRDGEVLRVKKHYLKLYLATRGVHSVSSPLAASSLAGAATIVNAVSPNNATAVAGQSSSSCRSRSFTCADLDQSKDGSNPHPRKRARTESGSLLKGGDEWKNRCQNARSLFCDSLPGLEEAARMFGYVSQ